MDGLTGFLTEDGDFRIVVAEVGRLANYLKEIHRFSYPVTDAVSRFVAGAALLSSDLKGKDVIGVYLNCSGPLGGIRTEVNAAGQLKAFALYPRAGVDETDSSYVMPLSQLIGRGTITVSRIMEGGRVPFTGTVEMEGEALAIGFSRYLMDSMQVHSAVLISNFLTADGEAAFCAGMLIQALPGASPEKLRRMENEIEGFPPFSEVLQEVNSAELAVRMLFSNFKPQYLFSRPLIFHCSCSKEKVARVLNSLSPEDLEDARQEDGLFHVNCDYCGTEYVVRPDELRK
ncbi:MAG: Hsp33 family molecular chaperone HslO [Acidobacteria bacterium]|nr:Hsp33 family molecular chaperone HslO [Acidobacteriota bacterium]